ncbi:MAG TPA: RNA 3'-terminal phosphate cyclase [Pirellulales bacterium]|nr:RNA 3'-terminal phosphate cyclase [Pirellulales bacterium]
MLTIDGSQGEGGGQILRTSLALAIVTGTPIRIEKIRAKRDKPGLRRQHLTAVLAAAQISDAAVSGDQVGSQQITFQPRRTLPGDYRFDVGSAGSTTLVLQTVLPPLMLAGGRSTLELIGGTHNPFAPPVDFLERAFLPILNRLGPWVTLTLERPGFYPVGGGRLQAKIEPAARLKPVAIVERGAIMRRSCQAVIANLPDHIAERELATVAAALDWPGNCLETRRYEGNFGPGNLVTIDVECEHVTEVFTGFGRRGMRAEVVAGEAAAEAQRWLASGVPVGEHLADQLLLPLALAGGGEFVTLPPSSHFTTNCEVLRRFLDVSIVAQPEPDGSWRMTVDPR